MITPFARATIAARALNVAIDPAGKIVPGDLYLIVQQGEPVLKECGAVLGSQILSPSFPSAHYAHECFKIV